MILVRIEDSRDLTVVQYDTINKKVHDNGMM